MKKYTFLFCLLFTFTAAWAQNSFETAYEMSGYSYKEPDGDMPIELSGRLQGASLSFKHLMQNNMFWKADFRYMGGETDYDGWLMSSPPTKHTYDDIGDYYWEARLHAGTFYSLSEQWEMWASLGLGYRFLKDHMNYSPFGYLRTSQYLYMPATAEIRRHSEVLDVIFNIEFDILLNGLQTSYMADSNPAYDRNFTNNQTSGLGLRLSVKFQKDFGGMGLFVEPFWRYWDIEDSDTALVYYMGSPRYMIEPHNTTNEYGLRAGIAF